MPLEYIFYLRSIRYCIIKSCDGYSRYMSSTKLIHRPLPLSSQTQENWQNGGRAGRRRRRPLGREISEAVKETATRTKICSRQTFKGKKDREFAEWIQFFHTRNICKAEGYSKSHQWPFKVQYEQCSEEKYT